MKAIFGQLIFSEKKTAFCPASGLACENADTVPGGENGYLWRLANKLICCNEERARAWATYHLGDIALPIF